MTRPLTTPGTRPPIERIVAVVPAHDEEAAIGEALDHLLAAAALSPVPVDLWVVLDSCTDGTADIVDTYPVEVAACLVRRVGAARGVGVRAGTSPGSPAGGVPAERCWVACTDADTQVGPTWFLDHLEAADRSDALLGRVRPDPRHLEDHLLALWQSLHLDPSRHVHGANLGVRLSAYRAVGGFPPLATGEDVALARALRAGGYAIASSGTPVLTSSRRTGRAPEGFAAYLRDLERLPAVLRT